MGESRLDFGVTVLGEVSLSAPDSPPRWSAPFHLCHHRLGLGKQFPCSVKPPSRLGAQPCGRCCGPRPRAFSPPIVGEVVRRDN